MSSYTPFYGTWHDSPSTLTPIVSAALTKMDNALATALPAIQTQVISTSSGNFTTTAVIRILTVLFSAAGRLRLYNNATDQTNDSSRAAGVAPTVTGILYEYNADTSNSDTFSINAYVGSGTTVYWTLSGGTPTVTMTWVAAVGS